MLLLLTLNLTTPYSRPIGIRRGWGRSRRVDVVGVQPWRSKPAFYISTAAAATTATPTMIIIPINHKVLPWSFYKSITSTALLSPPFPRFTQIFYKISLTLSLPRVHTCTLHLTDNIRTSITLYSINVDDVVDDDDEKRKTKLTVSTMITNTKLVSFREQCSTYWNVKVVVEFYHIYSSKDYFPAWSAAQGCHQNEPAWAFFFAENRSIVAAAAVRQGRKREITCWMPWEMRVLDYFSA